MNQTDNELLVRIDERLKALSDKLDQFMTTVKDGYVTKTEFESWQNKEFSFIKQNVENASRFKWILITSIVSGFGGLILSLIRK